MGYIAAEFATGFREVEIYFAAVVYDRIPRAGELGVVLVFYFYFYFV